MFRFTFMVQDKNVLDLMRALSGRVMELDVVPVENAVVKDKKVLAKTDGKMYEILVDYMREHDMAVITGKQAKKLVVELGGNVRSYSYYLQEAVRNKLLKKIGKGQGSNAMRYERVLLREAK